MLWRFHKREGRRGVGMTIFGLVGEDDTVGGGGMMRQPSLPIFATAQ